MACGLSIFFLLEPTIHGAENSPRFRGPNADGVSADDAGLPTTWTDTENVLWVTDILGWGWSCPTVWGDRVFLTAVVGTEENLTPTKGLYLGKGVREPAKGDHRWMVYCFDLSSGKKIWERESHQGRPKVPRHPKSTYATETATTDGERLYVLFGDLGLYCYDFNGEQLWTRPIAPKKTFFDYGAAASPVVHEDQVIVVYDNLEESWIAAFDTKSGEERWRTSRDETHSWATPFVWQNELRTEIVVPGKKRNRSYSLDGKVLWEFDGKMSNLVIPSPFAAHGMCYIAAGYVGDAHRPTFAIKPGANGDITPQDETDFATSPYIEWYQGRSSSYNPTQIVYGDYLYTLYDRGFLTCHNALTGEEIYGKQRFAPGSSFTASPWAYNDKLFCLSEDGDTFVVQLGPEFKLLETNPLDELCLSTPAIAGDKLLIRTASQLYCMTEGAKLAETPSRPGSRVKDVMNRAVSSGKVAGAAHLVVHGGEELFFHTKGVRDIEDEQPFERDTIVRIYSMSKPITSVAAMTLFEQGKFQLDDPIAKYIPSFANTTVIEKNGETIKFVPASRPITVRDVFRHTTGYAYSGSGIPELEKLYQKEGLKYRPPYGMQPPDMTIEQAAESLARIPALHHPGERFTYGFSTDLLGRLIEVWAGKSLDQYLRSSVLDPLSMDDTGFSVPAEKLSRFASCHSTHAGKLVIADKAATSPFVNGFKFLSGGGGLVSTIQDYSHFCQMMVAGGEFRGKRILKPATIELMFTDQLNGVAGEFQFGLGFAIGEVKLGLEQSQRTVKQFSWGGYASTDFRLVPEEKLFQIVLRQHIPTSNELANQLFPLVYESFDKFEHIEEVSK